MITSNGYRKIGHNSRYGNTNRSDSNLSNVRKLIVYDCLKNLPQRYKFGCTKLQEMCQLKSSEIYDIAYKMSLHNELPAGVTMTRSKSGAIHFIRD